MNSSPPSTKDNTPAAPAQPPFNWIEVLAIPLASSIMETQPIIIILLFLEPVLLNTQSGQLSINQAVLTLVLLSMQWWAWLVQHVIARDGQIARARIFHIAGLLAALLVSILITLYTASNIIFDLIVNIGIMLWAWKRGLDRTQTSLNEEQLTRAFKVGFIITIILLLFMMIFSNQSFTLPTDVLAQALPLFFLSGLLSLSLTRLLQIQQENARHPTGKNDSTRPWALTLTGLWIATVIAALTLETFSFTIIQRILLPIWDVLGTIVIWIVEILAFLIFSILNFFFKPSFTGALHPIIPATPRKPAIPPHTEASPQLQWLIVFGRFVLLALAILAVIFFVRLALSHLKTRRQDDAEEEEREGLDIGAILHERHEERQKRRQKLAAFTLEPLDPDSARARYREMLIALQADGAGLSRQAAETPQEYQQRLAQAIKTATSSNNQSSQELAILEELTHAYAHERYGARPPEQAERNSLSAGVPHLIQRLRRPRPAEQKQYEDRWGV